MELKFVDIDDYRKQVKHLFVTAFPRKKDLLCGCSPEDADRERRGFVRLWTRADLSD